MSGWFSMAFFATTVVLVVLACAVIANADEYVINDTMQLTVYVDNTTVRVNTTNKNYVESTSRPEVYHGDFTLTFPRSVINVSDCNIEKFMSAVPSNQTMFNIFKDASAPFINEVEAKLNEVKPAIDDKHKVDIEYTKCQGDLLFEAEKSKRNKDDYDMCISDKNAQKLDCEKQLGDKQNEQYVLLGLVVVLLAALLTNGFKDIGMLKFW